MKLMLLLIFCAFCPAQSLESLFVDSVFAGLKSCDHKAHSDLLFKNFRVILSDPKRVSTLLAAMTQTGQANELGSKSPCLNQTYVDQRLTNTIPGNRQNQILLAITLAEVTVSSTNSMELMTVLRQRFLDYWLMAMVRESRLVLTP